MARRKLTTELIVAEAIDLLGEEGLDGLSMRKLATRLQVQAPTLYYHIPDKSALLNEVLARLFSMCFERIPSCVTWQEWMLAFGGATAGRSALMRDLGLEGGGEGVDTGFAPDAVLRDGDRIEAAGLELTAIHTPGHMGGHLCFATGLVAFTADHVQAHAIRGWGCGAGDARISDRPLNKAACPAPWGSA